MAKIDIPLLKAQALNQVYRADLVRRDPAVIKAGKQFGTDAQQALNSGGDLIAEVREAWLRSAGTRLATSPVRPA